MLTDAHGRTDALLERVLGRGSGCPPRLAEAVRYAVLSGGKRIRPSVCLLSARAIGGPEHVGDAVPLAAAVEMVHAYSLVHDDLPSMDDDAVRRGQPSCHAAFGEALAILAGDALLTDAFGLVATAPLTPDVLVRCVTSLARAAGSRGMVGGQAVDTNPVDDLPEVTDVEALHLAKTGRLFGCAAELGGLAAGGTDRQLAALSAYGELLGRLFQVTDDLLDWKGPQATRPEELRSSLVARLGTDGTRAKAHALRDEAVAALRPLKRKPAKPLVELADRILYRGE